MKTLNGGSMLRIFLYVPAVLIIAVFTTISVGVFKSYASFQYGVNKHRRNIKVNKTKPGRSAVGAGWDLKRRRKGNKAHVIERSSPQFFGRFHRANPSHIGVMPKRLNRTNPSHIGVMPKH